jgi:multimeric flavodoxin WrbA
MNDAAGTDLLIVWHSRTGASAQLAQAAYDGGTRSGGGGTAPRVRRLGCVDATADDMLGARAYLFVCPENLASMTGEMKTFFDVNYYPLLDRIAGRAYATIVAAGSDGHGAARQIGRIATGWRLREVAEPMIVCMRAQTPEEILAPKTVPADSLAQAADLGQALAEGAAMGAL